MSYRPSDRKLEGLMIHLVFLPVLLLVLMPLLPYFAALEGRLLPVASKAKIVAIQPAADGTALIRVVWENTRACTFDHMVWNRVLPDGTLEAVKVTWGDPVGSRGPGRHLSQTWHVAMPVEQVEGKSLAYVWHQCHPGWLTISQFYP